ncbi:MAG: hypothetical protein WDW38_005524 [Sanguina aurantia]
MGQTFSHGNGIYVHLAQQTYFTGDTVTGTILLNVTKPFPCSSILLKVEGHEEVRWTERVQRSERVLGGDPNLNETRMVAVHIPHHARRSILEVNVPLHSYPQECIPGQYQFPFTFQLPVNLPSTFTFADHGFSEGGRYSDTMGVIRYSVAAECVVPGVFTCNLRGARDLTLLQRITFSPAQLTSTAHQHVRCCCCCNKGSASVTARVERGMLHAGETVNVSVSVENQSTVQFLQTEVRLCRAVHLTTGSSTRDHADAVALAVCPGLMPGTSSRGVPVCLAVPFDASPTATGQLLTCRYRVEVRMKTTCCMSDAVLEIPVVVRGVPPEEACSPALQPPPGWNPTVVGLPVTMTLPSAPPIAPSYVGGMDAGPDVNQGSSSNDRQQPQQQCSNKTA